MGATGNQGHFGSGSMEAGTDICTDRTGAEDSNFHVDSVLAVLRQIVGSRFRYELFSDSA